MPLPDEFTEADRSEALAILDRFQQIVDNEALARGHYVTGVVAQDRIGAICGGRNACAIGGLWLAAGVAPVPIYAGQRQWTLPGISEGEIREAFLADRPTLRLALRVLNEAAVFYADREEITLSGVFDDPLEDLFETGHRDEDGEELIDPSELTQVIAIARDRIADMAPAS